MGAKKITEKVFQGMTLQEVAGKSTYHIKTIERFAREGSCAL